MIFIFSCTNEGNNDYYSMIDSIYFLPEFKYNDSLDSIPNFFKDSIFPENSITDKYNKELFEITDVQIGKKNKSKYLYYVISNDELWLIYYLQGGMVRHNVLEIVYQKKQKFYHYKFITYDELMDTTELKFFLDSLYNENDKIEYKDDYTIPRDEVLNKILKEVIVRN